MGCNQPKLLARLVQSLLTVRSSGSGSRIWASRTMQLIVADGTSSLGR